MLLSSSPIFYLSSAAPLHHGQPFCILEQLHDIAAPPAQLLCITGSFLRVPEQLPILLWASEELLTHCVRLIPGALVLELLTHLSTSSLRSPIYM
ncbi:hypothetical protein M422DRAFT_34043, partial [Sphaerobolus stellatus SS14]